MPQTKLQSEAGQALASDFQLITPNDLTILPQPLRSIRCGSDGTIRLESLKGTVVNFDVLNGEILPGWIRRVHASGTTATNLVGYL